MRSISQTLPVFRSLSEERASRPRLVGLRWGFPLAAVALAAIGLFTVESASTQLARSYLPRQAGFLAIGVVLMIVAFAVDHRVLLRFALPAYLVSLVSLLLILVLGHEAGGARSWIRLGTFGGQPAEFAKLATALLVARYLAPPSQRFLAGRQLLVAALIVAAPVVLIAVQPDFGGAAMFAPMLLAAVWVAGIRWRAILVVAGLSLVAAGALWLFALRPYQKERVLSFLQPTRDPLGSGYQVQQSKIAVGAGQVGGKGYKQGTQSHLRFLPENHTDFIFAVLAEEWGFVGVAGVLGLYALYLWHGAAIAWSARDRAGILLVAALLGPLALHILYNTAMVVGLVPTTGIPLPFLSYGGSFLLFCFISTGIILGVNYRRYVNR
jgi:rod shape determining protein RodA